MSWFHKYRPQTSGTEVANVIRKNSNAWGALGDSLIGAGDEILKHKKRKVEEKNQKFLDAFNTAKLDDIGQNKADNAYMSTVLKGGKPKDSYEYNGKSYTPHAKTLKDEKDFIVKQYDDKLRKAFAGGNVKDWGQFATTHTDLINQGSGETILNLKNVWGTEQRQNKKDKREEVLFGLNKRNTKTQLDLNDMKLNDAKKEKKILDLVTKYTTQKELLENLPENEVLPFETLAKIKNYYTKKADSELRKAYVKGGFKTWEGFTSTNIDLINQGSGETISSLKNNWLKQQNSTDHKYSASDDTKIASIVKSALGLEGDYSNFDDNTKKLYNEAVTETAKIAKKYNYTPLIAYDLYLKGVQHKKKQDGQENEDSLSKLENNSHKNNKKSAGFPSNLPLNF